MKILFLFLTLILFQFPLNAYVGPGMGGGVIAAILGFIAAIFVGLWSILYFPIKRALNKKKNPRK